MGFIDTSENPAIPVFYNVNLSVGNNGANQRDDVKLVQYMLKHYFEAPHAQVGKPAGRKIEITGEYDFPTDNGIFWYQIQMSNLDPSTIIVDRRVDRILNKTNFKGSLTGKHYTLFWLNQNLKHLNPAAFAALPSLVPLNKMNIASYQELVPATEGF